MTATALRLGRGVRLSRDADGAALLLVPEGLLRLNDTAVAVLELVDGERSEDAIVDALAARYARARTEIAADVASLVERLVLRGYVRR